MADENLHAKHRARMQERVERDGLDSLAEHEALEYLLFLSIPRADTNALAHRLIQHYGRSEERRVGKECRSRWSPYH